MKSVLFYRNYLGFTGGHLKVRDYFNHVLHSKRYKPYIHFSGSTKWDSTNPWLEYKRRINNPLKLLNPDIYFLAGMDWLSLSEPRRKKPKVPIINLIQGIRHADKNQNLYSFLQHTAIRICVSKEIEAVIRNTGAVVGPVFTIPNAIDVSLLPGWIPYEKRQYDIVIISIKQLELGTKLDQSLNKNGRNVMVLTGPVPRPEFLNLISNAKVVICLPLETEGFYLPALEAMAVGSILVCPDCVGNRSFCHPEINCLMPEYSISEIVRSAEIALNLTAVKVEQFQMNAKKTILQHDIQEERKKFLEILEKAPEIWKDYSE